MSKFVPIMYVGRKSQKVDNVNQNSGGRVWNGLGDVIEVTPLEAVKLREHHGIWMDVSNLDEAARTKVIEAVREQMRAERRALQQTVQLKDASLDELEEEISRRRSAPDPKPRTVVAQPRGIDRRNSEGESMDGEAASRPTATAEVVDAIVTAISAMDADREEMFDEAGNPTKEAVESLLHYGISKSELKAGIAAHGQRLAG